MTKAYKILFILFLFNLTSFAQIGQQFPDISVTDLNDKSLNIPEDSKGKFTLVGVAFSEKAQDDLYSWSQPVFSEFMDENNMSSLVYDPNVYLILMFTGANQVAYKNAKKKITEGTDESLKDNVVLYKGAMEDYRDELNMKDKKVPYFYVLDKEGEVIYTAKGGYSKQVLKEVGDLIED